MGTEALSKVVLQLIQFLKYKFFVARAESKVESTEMKDIMNATVKSLVLNKKAPCE